MRLVLIALAGAAGTLCRYGTMVLARRVTPEWPLATVLVNVAGCFVLALLSEVVLRGTRVNEDLRLVIGVGFCGGLTTYSTFNQDALMLFRLTSTVSTVVYVLTTFVLCAAASVFGVILGRALTPLTGLS